METILVIVIVYIDVVTTLVGVGTMSELRMIVLVPAGNYKANDEVQVPSLDVVRWYPSSIGARIRVSLLEHSILDNTACVASLYVELWFYDSSGNLIDIATLQVPYSGSDEASVPSGTSYVEVHITQKTIRFVADATVWSDSVWSPQQATELIRVEMLDASNNVLDTVSLVLSKVVSTVTVPTSATVTGVVPTYRERVSSSNTWQYIYAMTLEVLDYRGTPSQNDYVELKLLDENENVVASCQVAVRAGEACDAVPSRAFAWIVVTLNTSSPGLVVYCQVLERVRGFE